MSDQDNLNLEDVGAGVDEVQPEGRKVGFLPAVVIQVLKWVAIGLGFIILGATTTFITNSLLQKGRERGQVASSSPEMRAKNPPREFNDTIETVRGVTSDEVPTIFTVSVSLGHAKGDADLSAEITERKREIGNIIMLMFSKKTLEELRPSHYEALQLALQQAINDVLVHGRIEQVVFKEFIVAQ